MAKKDDKNRVLIPDDIVKRCSFLKKEPLSKNEGFIFFLNNHDKVGITYIDIKCRFPSNFKFLGTCNYDKKTHKLYIPENVDAVLGDGEDYYFATSLKGREYLYIYKRESNIQKLSILLSKLIKENN